MVRNFCVQLRTSTWPYLFQSNPIEIQILNSFPYLRDTKPRVVKGQARTAVHRWFGIRGSRPNYNPLKINVPSKFNTTGVEENINRALTWACIQSSVNTSYLRINQIRIMGYQQPTSWLIIGLSMSLCFIQVNGLIFLSSVIFTILE